MVKFRIYTPGIAQVFESQTVVPKINTGSKENFTKG